MGLRVELTTSRLRNIFHRINVTCFILPQEVRRSKYRKLYCSSCIARKARGDGPITHRWNGVAHSIGWRDGRSFDGRGDSLRDTRGITKRRGQIAGPLQGTIHDRLAIEMGDREVNLATKAAWQRNVRSPLRQLALIRLANGQLMTFQNNYSPRKIYCILF